VSDIPHEKGVKQVTQIGQFYTLDAAAKKLGLSYPQLWRKVRRGDIPTIRIGKSILVRLEDVRGAISSIKR
jgi:excisionase family DNA binding protein